MRRNRAIGRAQAGFTLIELLVALTLFGLIAVVLFGGLTFGTRAWEAGNAQADRLAEVEAVQSLLRRQLARSLPFAERSREALSDEETSSGETSSGETSGDAAPGDEDARPAAFIGEAARMAFLAPAPPQIGVGGIYLFELSVEEGPEARRLVLAWRLPRGEPLPPEASPSAAGGRRVLLDGLDSSRFSYFGSPRADEPADWQESWDGRQGPPRLVAVDLAFAASDRRRWPRLLIAPRSALDLEPRR